MNRSIANPERVPTGAGHAGRRTAALRDSGHGGGERPYFKPPVLTKYLRADVSNCESEG